MIETRVRLESKIPHNTLFLHVWADENDSLTKLRSELASIGWEEDAPSFNAPPYKGQIERYFGRRGTGLFSGWTKDEKAAYTRDIRYILRQLGYKDIPYYKLTLADCL